MPPEDENKVSNQPQKDKMNFTLDFRRLAGVLILVIIVMLFIWKPWEAKPKAADRTITVTGQSTITSTPDEYVFNPTYDFKSTDKQTALTDMTKQSDLVVAKLKQLGVSTDKIKTDSSGYSGGVYLPTKEPDGTTTYTLNITVTVTDKTLAQKVQDYLVGTNPTGSVTPLANFSDAKTKQLKSQGRDQATKDAKIKADQSAKNLGFKVIGVKSVDDSGGFGGGCGDGMMCPMSAMSDAKGGATSNSTTLSIQSGENKLNYSVKVVYYIH